MQGGDCLAHVTDSEFAAEIARLRNGGELDARGVTLNPALLQALFDQLRPDEDSAPQVPRAAFRGAQFFGPVAFSGAQFPGDA